MIFAEGSRTKTGRLGAFKRGAFKIAEDLRLPIVPVSIDGAFDVLPASSYYVRPGRITVTFHEPIDTQDLDRSNMDEFILRTRAAIESGL